MARRCDGQAMRWAGDAMLATVGAVNLEEAMEER